MSKQTKPLVIKIGGAILEKADALTALLKVIAELKNQPVVLVHGGGCVVDDMLCQAGFATEKKNGLRVTSAEQMPIISGALAGHVNKVIVAQANSLHLNAVGLSLADGNMVKCVISPLDLGAVGEPKASQSKLLDNLLKGEFLPVVSSIGALESGELVNVNADDAAVVICQLLNAELLLLTDVNGVMDGSGNYLSDLTEQDAKLLIQSGIIHGGMTAKVNAAFHAANQLRRSIAVASWQAPEQIPSLLSGANVGTRIIPELAA
ncbi:acetylglutamate kinase [Thalassotalea sp. M1531]|uniref:Acetylglutamate kinase n=1 Tax=Thalassotalea algicola TaxID=2716224 RepID=A0A7Y0L9K6_9GAMM|nr:acetylglutamate kinase [Thalassotalea algicola]NMP30489.1 acetylglutamate kinase [Thalassotalea algicola]